MNYDETFYKAMEELRKRYAVIVIDKEKPPVEGDTITIGNLKAEFKKV